MKRKLVIKPRAELDLIDHCVYLAIHNPKAAESLRGAAQSAISDIAARPRAAAALQLPEYVNQELRFRKPRGFKNYLVVFQVTDDAILILRILHGSQDIESAFRQ